MRSFLLTSLLLPAAANAQLLPLPGTTKSATYSLPYGVTKAGGEVTFDKKTRLVAIGSAVLLEATDRARATVRLFGNTYEAVAIEAEGRVAQGTFTQVRAGWVGSPGPTTGSAEVTLRLAGFTVWNDTSAQTKSWSKALGPYDLLPQPLCANFTIGPVPVVVKANAGVGGQLGISVGLDLSAPKASLSGFANAYAYGWASAGVGMQGASAGVKATLKFANATAVTELTAAPAGLGGSLALIIVPLQLVMSIYAELGSQSWDYPVYEWSMDQITKTIPLQ